MKFGIYISNGNGKDKKKAYCFLPLVGSKPVLEGETESLTNSEKERSTASFFSYLSARFFGFFSFIGIKLHNNKTELLSGCIVDIEIQFPLI